MRILVFLPALTLGGAERQGLFVARHLKNRGHDVEVWGFPPPGTSASLLPELRHHELRYEELRSWPQFDWRFANDGLSLRFFRGYYGWLQRLRWFAAAMPSQTFDVVIPFTFWPSLVTCLMRKRFGARKIYWSQRGGYDDAGVLYNRFLIKQVLAHRPQFVANSRAGAKFLQDTFGLSSTEVMVIPNAYAADAEESKTHQATRDSEASELSLIHVANFYPEKDYDTVLRALQILDTQKTPCRLHICGAFISPSDQPKFFARICELGIEHRVVYHGPTPRQDVLRLLLKADIGLLSSKSEGQPNSVMEYMYSGLPVIATNIPGVREIVGEANEKYLFELGDAPTLARLISHLKENPALRAEVGLHNRQRIIAHFAPEQVLPRWAELVERK